MIQELGFRIRSQESEVGKEKSGNEKQEGQGRRPFVTARNPIIIRSGQVKFILQSCEYEGKPQRGGGSGPARLLHSMHAGQDHGRDNQGKMMDNTDNTATGTKPGSILLIEADPEQARGMQAELAGQDHAVIWSNSHLKALSILEDRSGIDVVLVAAETTDIGGFDFIHLLRHRNRFTGLNPQVVVIAPGEFFESFPPSESGIDDYLLRPYFPGELSWRVGKAVRAARSLKRLESSDKPEGLSGVFSPARLEGVLIEEMNKVFRKKGCFSMILYQFQRLDEIRLNHGHMMVEWMERDLTAAIRSSLRSYDRLGMLEHGGYCLIVPEVDGEALPLVLERLKEQVQKWNFNVARHSNIRIPVVPGMRAATVHPDHGPGQLQAAARSLKEWIDQEQARSFAADEPLLEFRLTGKGMEPFPSVVRRAPRSAAVENEENQ